MPWLISIVLPLLLYSGLVFLPIAGAVRLLALSTIGIGALWLEFYLNPTGSALPEAERGIFGVFVLLAFTIALVLGGTMLVLKTRLPKHWPSWSWPVCALLALFAVCMPFLRILEV